MREEKKKKFKRHTIKEIIMVNAEIKKKKKRYFLQIHIVYTRTKNLIADAGEKIYSVLLFFV